MNFSNIIVVFFIFVVFVQCNPKKYTPNENEFQPSNIRYYEQNLPRNVHNTTQEKDQKESGDRIQRFGMLPVTNYGNTGSGINSYPHNGVGYMSPVKIDIGGIALGALIGLGAILVLPKLATIFSGGYGYRSLENDMSSVTDILSRIDNTLEKHNIDSSSCMQRLICSYVHESQKNMQGSDGNTIDQVVYSLTNNSLFTYLLDGTAVKQAIDMGKQRDLNKCAALHMKCPISKENVMQIITTLISNYNF